MQISNANDIIVNYEETWLQSIENQSNAVLLNEIFICIATAWEYQLFFQFHNTNLIIGSWMSKIVLPSCHDHCCLTQYRMSYLFADGWLEDSRLPNIDTYSQNCIYFQNVQYQNCIFSIDTCNKCRIKLINCERDSAMYDSWNLILYCIMQHQDILNYSDDIVLIKLCL